MPHVPTTVVQHLSNNTIPVAIVFSRLVKYSVSCAVLVSDEPANGRPFVPRRPETHANAPHSDNIGIPNDLHHISEYSCQSP